MEHKSDFIRPRLNMKTSQGVLEANMWIHDVSAHIPRMCFGNSETYWISRDVSQCLVVVASCTAQANRFVKIRKASSRTGQFGVKQAARI